MTFGHSNIIQRRQSCRRRRPLEDKSRRNVSPLSVGRLCLLSIAIAAIGTHAPLTEAKSNPIMHRLHNLRGGSSNSGVPGGDLNDQDLDEYIDFLLAYADDKATEEDNPLFKDDRAAAQALLENLEESTAVEEETLVEDVQEDEEEVPLVSSTESLEPLVDDVHNDTQIDAMVDTLVASVDDKDLEEEEEPEIAVSATIPQEETASEDTEKVVESETFYLGSSAVDEMPPPVAVEETAEVTTASTEEPSKPGFFGSVMQKIGLKKKEGEPSEVEDATVVEESVVEPTIVEEVATEVEPETTIADSIEPAIEETAPVDSAEPIEEETTPVDSAEPIEEETPIVEEVVVESSDVVEEPDMVTISEPEIESPTESATESAQEDEEEAPKADRMKQLMAPLGAAATALDATKTTVVASLGTAKTTVVSSFGVAKTTVASSLDATKTTVVSSAKSYYQGALGSVQGAWSKRPWKSAPPERDYSKIYHKYFAEPASDEEVVPEPQQPNRLASAFLKPWGTVKKYIPKDILTGAEDSYSIGITGHVTEDMSVAEADSETQVDAEAVVAAQEATVEISEQEVEAVVDEEVPEDSEILVDTTEPEEVVEEFAEDAEVLETTEVVVEEVTRDAEVVMESTEVELEVDVDEVAEDAEVEEDIEEEITEESEIVTESIDAEAELAVKESIEVETEVNVDEVTEDSEVVTENIVVEADVEEVAEDAEAVSESIMEEVAVDEASEDAEDISESIEVEAEADVGEVAEDAEITAESVEVEVEADVEEVAEDAETIAEAEVDIEDAEAIAESAELEAEVDIEEVAQESIDLGAELEVEDVEEDAVDVTEVIEVEVDADADTEEVQEDSVFIEEDEEIVADIEDVPEDSVIDSEVSLGETEVEAAVEVGIEEVPEEVEVDDEMISEETVDETEESPDPSEDATGEVPRKATFFTRLWGTSKAPKNADPVEVDSESTEITAEETFTETDDSIDDDEMTSEESSRKPTLFARLWGVSKEPGEIYSLGLQGVNNFDSETGEDVSVGEADELDVDVSVSIGIVEEEETLDSIEISESSGVEDMEDDIEDDVQLEILENEEEVDVVIEDMEADRNVFQLHVPEKQGETEESSLPETESVGVTATISPSEDLDGESVEISSLQLHQEDSISVSDDDEIVNEVPSELEIEVEHYPDADASEEDSEEWYAAEGDLIEEQDEEEDVNDEFIVADIDQDLESDESEDVEEVFVADVVDDKISDESEDAIEMLDEEDEEGSFVTATAEDLLSDDAEEFTEPEEFEEVVEEEVSIEISEESVLEDLEMDENEEEEQFYVDDVDEDESSPYSLEVEMQNANFVARFLVNRGMYQVIMIAIVLSEWVRSYILAPFIESFDWIKEGKAQDLLQNVISTRGGALAPALSESEGQTDEEEEVDEEEDSCEEKSAESAGADSTESDSSTDKKAKTEQEDPAEVPAEESLPATPRVPPNFLFRRLLDYGFWGHFLIMEIILALEWIKVFVPDISRSANYIMHDVLKFKRRSGRQAGEPDNFMNAGFVNTGEGSRLGRKSKKMRKKEDQKALAQLQDIGDVNEAKYSYVSSSFLERHGIGPYNVAVSEIEIDHRPPKRKSGSTKNLGMEDDEEDESDSGWILDALGVEKEEEEPTSSDLPFDTSVGVSMGSGGPALSVGVEFNLGGKKKAKKNSSLSNVIKSGSNARKPKRSQKPHVSDSESGIMGRLRAQGANSLVGRNLLGAYPGDLPPPDEAADSRGVIDMAQRYGYGDWSDDDESDEYAFGGDDNEEEEDPFFADEDEIRPKKKSRKRTKTKKRRSSSSRNRQNIEVGVGIDLSSSSQEQAPVSSVLSRPRRKRTTPAASSTSISSSLSGSRRRRKTRNSQLPSLAMEKLGKPASSTSSSKSSSAASTPSSNSNAKDILSVADKLKSKTKTKSLSPAMSLLDKAKKSADTTSSKSQNDDN